MINIQLLEEEFQERLIALINRAIDKQVKIEPVVGLVSINDQAKKWRQSKNDCEIDGAIEELKLEGADYLSRILTQSSTKPGPHLTDDLPGFTWLNYGEAIEARIFDISSGKEFSKKESQDFLKKNIKGHDISFYENSASGNFVIHKSTFQKPINVFSAKEIDNLMHNKWAKNDNNIF